VHGSKRVLLAMNMIVRWRYRTPLEVAQVASTGAFGELARLGAHDRSAESTLPSEHA
jgi:hypothetical protein